MVNNLDGLNGGAGAAKKWIPKMLYLTYCLGNLLPESFGHFEGGIPLQPSPPICGEIWQLGREKNGPGVWS